MLKCSNARETLDLPAKTLTSAIDRRCTRFRARRSNVLRHPSGTSLLTEWDS